MAHSSGKLAAAARARSVEARQAKREAILAAALDVFAENGFAEARLDEVARRAGVAKGTLYLYAESKEALFESLLRAWVAQPIDALKDRLMVEDASLEAQLRILMAFFQREVMGTRRRDIIRLILTEGMRFPAIAEAHYREVVCRGLGVLRQIVERAVERGELRSDALARFPQLVVAPALLALVWKTLFDRFEPLDAEAMLDTHVSLLMRAITAEGR